MASSKPTASLGLDSVVKDYPNGVCALKGIDIEVQPGQCLALVGPSGCGKTTLLRLVAGLEAPTSGTIRIGGRSMNGVPPHRRDVAMAFQTPGLSPGQTVRQNLIPAWTSVDSAALVEIADLLRIADLLDRVVAELSGGEQQRVALGRALLRRAPVCLLDEPLGHLESPLRLQLRRDLRLLSRRFPATMIHVTHDPAEALAVGDQVAVLHEGRLQQVGTPDAVYCRPANRIVASLCRPTMNFIASEGGVTLGIEAQDVRIGLADDATETPGRIIMDVVLTEYSPQGRWLTCRKGGVQVTGLDVRTESAAIGSKVLVSVDMNRAYQFETATGKLLRAPL